MRPHFASIFGTLRLLGRPMAENRPASEIAVAQTQQTRQSIQFFELLIHLHMRSVNKVILVGHLAADPETFQTKSGRIRVTFPLATHRDSTSDGERREVTDYHRVVTWDKLGEVCATYLARGQGVYVEGVILNRAFEKNGERKFVTEIRADEINMLTWKKRVGVGTAILADPDPTAA